MFASRIKVYGEFNPWWVLSLKFQAWRESERERERKRKRERERKRKREKSPLSKI